MTDTRGWRLGADIGGTFTDLVLVAPDGRAAIRKVLSSTQDYAQALIAGAVALMAEMGTTPADLRDIIHGTTVATNAILQRSGARTALLTTEGFRDLLEIGRLRLSRLYDLDHVRPAPLVRRRWRLEVTERVDHRGAVVTPLDNASVQAAIDVLIADRIEAVAVCLLHSYANPAHEQAIGAAIRARLPDLAISLSSEVLPEIREFERASTTVANAYVVPVLARYIANLEHAFAAIGVRERILVMQSNGGITDAAQARRLPVQLIESGPAAGVIAAAALARRCGIGNLISVDMGGTTTKASVIEDGEIARSAELEIGGPISQGSRLNRGGGYLLRTPSIDIAEIGAGGGSLVSVDRAGALRVGPGSAGSHPGPVCYDFGGMQATLTDANVALGYLPQERLPSGMVLNAGAARRAIGRQVGEPLGLDSAAAAHGVYRLGCAGIARAVRAVTVERGRDPREFVMAAFGGNGPLFAAEVARSLEIGTVIVPPAPGVFSALGLLAAETEHHGVRTLNRALDELTRAELIAAFADLRRRAKDALPSGDLQFDQRLDVKYVGQSFELAVAACDTEAFRAEIAAAFTAEHERTYGHKAEGDPIQVVNARLIARLPSVDRPPPALPFQATGGAVERSAYFGPEIGWRATIVLSRGDLRASPRPGPILVEEYDATTLVPPDAAVHLDPAGNIVITWEPTA